MMTSLRLFTIPEYRITTYCRQQIRKVAHCPRQWLNLSVKVAQISREDGQICAELFKDKYIIGIPYYPYAFTHHLLVELIEVDVTK